MSHVPNDDLFEGTTMTFGEHLEELRVSLYKALIGLAIGTLVSASVAHLIVQAIQTPLKNALDRYYLDKATGELEAEYGDNAPPELLALIKDEGLVPTSVKLEAAGILAGLRAADPQQFGDIQFIPHRFVASDIRVVDSSPEKGFAEFCKKLREDGQSDRHTPGRLMWSLLSQSDQHNIERISDQSAINSQDRQRVIAILNELAEREDIPVSPEFKGIDGRYRKPAEHFNPIAWMNRWSDDVDRHQQAAANTVTQLRREISESAGSITDSSQDKLRRLNKLLIASAYSDVLRPPQLLIVDVPSWKPIDTRVQSLQAQEPFMIWLKAAVIAGFVLTSPWIFWQVWSFVAAGLYPHEKRYVHIYLPFSLVLFIAGCAMAFFFVFEPVLGFLFSFNKLMDIDPDPRISEWLSFVLFLPLGFGIAFQLPLVMLFLNRIGILSVESYLEKWRIAILVIFVISMLLTPADPISMLLMAFPLTILYFLGILLCKWMPRGRNPFDDAYEP